jgi:DNA polymerase V
MEIVSSFVLVLFHVLRRGKYDRVPSPATIYLEAVIDLAAILDLRKPSRYLVRVVGGALPARGIAVKDILVVDCALDRAPDRVCVVMASG